MKTFTHEGLIAHTHMRYVIRRQKRVYLDDQEPDPSARQDTWFEFEGYMPLPLLLLPATWQRYGYNADDVQQTFDKIQNSAYVWQIALMTMMGKYEPEAKVGGIRSTFQSMFTFLFNNRKDVLDNLLNEHRDYISEGPSVLCKQRPDHAPLLPLVDVPPHTFLRARSQVPKKPPSFCWEVTYPELYPWKDVFFVPVEYDEAHQLVYMVRVILQEVYDDMPIQPKDCCITKPVVVRCGQLAFVLTEEACFFQTRQTTKRKRGKISSENNRKRWREDS